MITGRSLPALEAELTRQCAHKRDFLAPTCALHMRSNGHSDLTWGTPVQNYALSETAHSQIAEYAGIPRTFYEFLRARTESLRVPVPLPLIPPVPGEEANTGQLRLAENTPLFDVVVNRLLHSKGEDRRLIRTLDGKARAFLSSSFTTDLDNYDVYQAAAEAILQAGLCADNVLSSEVTDTRLYLKVVSPRLVGDVAVGDTVQAGFILTNSEVGVGSLSIRQFLLRLVCANGMVIEDTYKARHVGRKLEADTAGMVYKSDTRQAEARLRLLSMRDHIQAALEEHRFAQTLVKLQQSKAIKLEGKLETVIEVTARKFGLHEEEKQGVFQRLIEGADLSLWGLSNAITRTAQEAATYDRRTDLEIVGGRFLTLSAADIQDIARAA